MLDRIQFAPINKELVHDIVNNPDDYEYLPMAVAVTPPPLTIIRRYDRGKVQPRGTPRTNREAEG